MPVTERPKPSLVPEYCKGCGRCVSVCVKGCIAFDDEINPATGVVPVVIDLEKCNGCGLCIEACPEPYGLRALDQGEDYELQDPAKLYGARLSEAPEPEDIPAQRIPLPACQPLVIKGNYAAALGALLAGCRHVYGYPITPSTEGAELMSKLLPRLDGVFLQAVSEVATVNHMYGTGGAGLPCLTFTSSPGFSLMLEGISYMAGAEVPAVFINIMRGGPGLGNIAPEQSDIKLACRGLGHGNTHAICLTPSTPQEMLDLTILAFELSFKYRHPVILLADGYLGQMTGKVQLPDHMTKPGIPKWAVYGDLAHRKNLINSIYLDEHDLERHNEYLCGKYEAMQAEARAETFLCEDAELIVVACNTPARAAKGAVQELRHQGLKAGLFRPLTVWPFPVEQLKAHLGPGRRLLVVEASAGQLEDELRLALSHAGLPVPPVAHVRRMGGMLPQQDQIVAAATAILA
ncbi:MAG: 3-methyl-2-oxobutanoate dehydrogenase subunit VorB [Acidobacteria bacterium]|nr:3-methyl-2-oxobutanoate dehydrogenase subunit VorB [Acidobacteriota bacterium]